MGRSASGLRVAIGDERVQHRVLGVEIEKRLGVKSRDRRLYTNAACVSGGDDEIQTALPRGTSGLTAHHNRIDLSGAECAGLEATTSKYTSPHRRER